MQAATKTSDSLAMVHAASTLYFVFAAVMDVMNVWLIHSPVSRGFPAALVGLVLLVGPEKQRRLLKLDTKH